MSRRVLLRGRERVVQPTPQPTPPPPPPAAVEPAPVEEPAVVPAAPESNHSSSNGQILNLGGLGAIINLTVDNAKH